MTRWMRYQAPPASPGAADSILILKRGRGKVDGTLSITGRDVEEQELALKFHPDEGAWELMGDAAEYAQERGASRNCENFTGKWAGYCETII